MKNKLRVAVWTVPVSVVLIAIARLRSAPVQDMLALVPFLAFYFYLGALESTKKSGPLGWFLKTTGLNKSISAIEVKTAEWGVEGRLLFVAALILWFYFCFTI